MSEVIDLKERLNGINHVNVTLRDQGNIYTQNENLLIQNNFKNNEQFKDLQDSYSKLMQVNENLKQQLILEREQLSNEYLNKQKNLENRISEFEQESDKYIPKSEFEKLRKEKTELMIKYRELCEYKIDDTIKSANRFEAIGKGGYDPKLQLNLISGMLDSIKNN